MTATLTTEKKEAKKKNQHLDKLEKKRKGEKKAAL